MGTWSIENGGHVFRATGLDSKAANRIMGQATVQVDVDEHHNVAAHLEEPGIAAIEDHCKSALRVLIRMRHGDECKEKHVD